MPTRKTGTPTEPRRGKTGRTPAARQGRAAPPDTEARGARKNPLAELLCQALETELGGVKVYTTALRCAQNDELREEWQKYLAETERHAALLRAACEEAGVDPETQTVGRQIVRQKAQSLVSAMDTALRYGTPEDAQIVACECVVDAETKDHANWELIGQVVEKMEGWSDSALKAAYDEVEDQEDEHLYHTKGWCRELWLQSLGIPAVLPPPEERQDVKDARAAEDAKESRDAEAAR